MHVGTEASDSSYGAIYVSILITTYLALWSHKLDLLNKQSNLKTFLNKVQEMLLRPWFLSGLVLETLEVRSATSTHLLVWTCFCIKGAPLASPIWETTWSLHTAEWVMQGLWFTLLLAWISGSLGQRKRATEHILSLKETEELSHQ